MGMADQSGLAGPLVTMRFVLLRPVAFRLVLLRFFEQRLQPASGPIEKQRFKFTRHVSYMFAQIRPYLSLITAVPPN
jgi:hypothetical protein